MAVAKFKTSYTCQNCGAASPRWQGKCDDCGAWNSFVEESASSGVAAGPVRSSRRGRVIALSPLAGETPEAPRIVSGMAEFDRVTGGGFVRGSVRAGRRRPRHRQVDAAAPGGRRPRPERAPRRLRLGRGGGRAGPAPRERLGAHRCPGAARRRDLRRGHPRHAVEDGPPPASSSTRSRPCGPTHGDSAPGTVTQVRASAQALIRFAKQTGAAVMLVGHVTKDGQIAGPAWSSTWSTRCSISRARAGTSSASCVR
jgi:DNA repair protein RadA/Sms